MLKSNKKAFSMVELIIVFSIIGLIVVAELIILNTKLNEYANPYYAAYNALKKASYNVLADLYCPNPSSPDPQCKIGPRPFPTNSRDMCRRLVEFINTSEVNCNSIDAQEINDFANNIDVNHPHFISSNSYRFYIGGLKTTEAPNSIGTTDEIEYFVVYVDINGTQRPNRITCDGPRILPDIVPFAVTTRGEVVPMGLPVYNKAYMTAKIKYPSHLTSGADGDKIENKQSASMSFYEAAYGAWPPEDSSDKDVFRYSDIPFSIMFSEDPIYDISNINQCTDIDTAAANGLKNWALYKDEAISQRNKGCEGGTFSCQVVIDSAIGTRF